MTFSPQARKGLEATLRTYGIDVTERLVSSIEDTLADYRTHKVTLNLASGAQVTLLSFSPQEARWIFSYDYVEKSKPSIINKVRLTADYTDGILAKTVVLSMHVILPQRLGQKFFAGLDISPGAKTYLEFTYEREKEIPPYKLVEICKGANTRIRLDQTPEALTRLVEFPFPIPDRVDTDGFSTLRVPFLLNTRVVSHFEFPWSTLQ